MVQPFSRCLFEIILTTLRNKAGLELVLELVSNAWKPSPKLSSNSHGHFPLSSHESSYRALGSS